MAILEEETKAKFGYYSREIAHFAHKRIVAQCDLCGKVRTLDKNNYSDLCNPCSKKGRKYSEASCRKKSESQKGEKSIHYGKPLSDEHRNKISNALKGRIFSEEHCEKLRGKYHHAWKGGVSFGKYCPKFNNALKEKIREKYGRTCYLCGKTEEANGRKLDVHHIDKDKKQGCKGKTWFLLPLCISCHSKLHNPKSKKEKEIKVLYYQKTI